MENDEYIELEALCEGTSELSVEDSPENGRDVIVDGENSDFEDYNRSLSLSDSSSINATQSTISQSETSFKKLSSLNLAFTRVWQADSRRTEGTCTGCQKVKKTNEVVRYVKHAKKCRKLDQTVKDAIAQEFKEYLWKEDEHVLLADKLLT